AFITEGDHVLVERAAMMTENIAGVERVGTDGRAATAARRPQMVQTFQIAALALPISDRVVDEFQFAHSAEIRNRKYGIEHRLQTDIFTLIGQKIHLQKSLVRLFLYFDQVRNWNGSFDFGEIHPLTCGGIVLCVHSLKAPDGRLANAAQAAFNTKPTAHREWEPLGAPNDETWAGIDKGAGRLLRMRTGLRELRAQKSCVFGRAKERRRTPLLAVWPSLQLKYQDLGITVTNWDRIRLTRRPNYLD